MFPVVLLQITAVSNSHSIRSVEYSYSDYFYNRQHQSEEVLQVVVTCTENYIVFIRMCLY